MESALQEDDVVPLHEFCSRENRIEALQIRMTVSAVTGSLDEESSLPGGGGGRKFSLQLAHPLQTPEPAFSSEDHWFVQHSMMTPPGSEAYAQASNGYA